MRSVLPSLVLALALLSAPASFAAERGSPEEAKAMAVKAAAYVQEVGPEKAFAAFGTDAAWHDRDLYVFVEDDTFIFRAHGALPATVGRSFADLKDVDGKPFIRELAAIKTDGWVDYKWQDPISKKVEPKKTFGVRVGEYIVCVGVYAD
jgi:cytochrome c